MVTEKEVGVQTVGFHGRPREIARSDFSCSTPAIPIRYRTRCVFQLVDEHICLVCWSAIHQTPWLWAGGIPQASGLKSVVKSLSTVDDSGPRSNEAPSLLRLGILDTARLGIDYCAARLAMRPGDIPSLCGHTGGQVVNSNTP